MQANTVSGNLIPRRVSIEDKMPQVQALAATSNSIPTPRSARTDPLNFQILDKSGICFSKSGATHFLFNGEIAPEDIFSALHTYFQAVRINPNVGKIKSLRFKLKTKKAIPEKKAECVIEFGENNKIISASLTTENINGWEKHFSYEKPLQKTLERFQKDAPKLVNFSSTGKISINALSDAIKAYLESANKEASRTFEFEEDIPAVRVELNQERTKIQDITFDTFEEDHIRNTALIDKELIKIDPQLSSMPYIVDDEDPKTNKSTRTDLKTSITPRPAPTDPNNIVYVTHLFNHKFTDFVTIEKNSVTLSTLFDQLAYEYARSKVQRFLNMKSPRYNPYHGISLSDNGQVRKLTPKNLVADLELALDNVSWWAKIWGNSAKAYKALKMEHDRLQKQWMEQRIAKPKISIILEDKKVSYNPTKFKTSQEYADYVETFRSEKKRKAFVKQFNLSWYSTRRYLSIFDSAIKKGGNSEQALFAAHNLAITCVHTAAPAA